MKFSSVKVFLETMCEYNTVQICQSFTTDDGQNLSVCCLPGTTTFEVSNSQTQEVLQIDSVEKTAEYVVTFLASNDLSINS